MVEVTEIKKGILPPNNNTDKLFETFEYDLDIYA